MSVKNTWKEIFCRDYLGNLTIEYLQTLIDKGSDVNWPIKHNKTALHFTIEKYSDLNIIQFLIDNGANVNALTTRKWTPLHFATRRGCFDVVRLLIDVGADVNASTEYKWTPLHCVIWWENSGLDVVEFLVNKGADVNALTNQKCKPLHFAVDCVELNYNIIDFLICNGTTIKNTDVCNEKGETFADCLDRIKNPDLKATFEMKLQLNEK